jgi:toxin YoeB
VNLLFLADGWDDYRYWQANDPAMTERINALLADTMRHPFTGLGKPEPLKRDYAGWWSRRITAEHRLVYRCVGSGEGQRIEIAQCRYHY